MCHRVSLWAGISFSEVLSPMLCYLICVCKCSSLHWCYSYFQSFLHHCSMFRLYLLFPPTSSIFVLYFSNEERVRNILAPPSHCAGQGHPQISTFIRDNCKSTYNENMLHNNISSLVLQISLVFTLQHCRRRRKEEVQSEHTPLV